MEQALNTALVVSLESQQLISGSESRETTSVQSQLTTSVQTQLCRTALLVMLVDVELLFKRVVNIISSSPQNADAVQPKGVTRSANRHNMTSDLKKMKIEK